MSDLSEFRSHCRKMADPQRNRTRPIKFTKAELALWRMLADEVTAYLAGDVDVVCVPDADDEPLFGDAS